VVPMCVMLGLNRGVSCRMGGRGSVCGRMCVLPAAREQEKEWQDSERWFLRQENFGYVGRVCDVPVGREGVWTTTKCAGLKVRVRSPATGALQEG
jgi:hypothetical protein